MSASKITMLIQNVFQFLAILESLKDWIRNIPEGNRLYDPLGVRVYWRDVYEIHILYFVIIITYFHLRGQNNPFSAASIASLVASSCIARLYEEINYRDDINYLLGLNNWFLMVASVPQLLYNAGVSLYGQDKLCTEELDILVASLEQMEIKWPGATIVLNVVVRLRNSQKLASIPISQPFVAPEAAWDEETEISALRDLFPFPSSLSPRMSLLDYDADDLRYPAVGEVGQPFDENLNWIFSEFTELSYRQSFVDGHNLFSPGC